MTLRHLLCAGLIMAGTVSLYAQDNNTTTTPVAVTEPTDALHPQNEKKPAEEKKWYDRFSIRGYLQFRQNNLINTNDDLGCAQCDANWGGNGGISIRRARINILGQVYQNIYFKLEADFAASVTGSTTGNYTQLRDAYVDVGLDPENVLKVRIGQSKVPYGFENLQSSGNRLMLDRADAMNSALLNERDLGAFLYFTPVKFKKLYADLVNQNYKGSGDFGLLAFGVYNGQATNRQEMNKSQHIVARATYPFIIGNQIIEASLQGYAGRYVLYDSQLTSGISYTADKNYTDQRAAASFILYPRPFGIQAEYNIGRGPQFDKTTQSIVEKDLDGGYVMTSYRLPVKNMLFFPFARYQYYNGGRKFETDARSYAVHQIDLGMEWQVNKYFELSAEYCISDRQYEDYALQDNHQKGNSLRVQAQVNF